MKVKVIIVFNSPIMKMDRLDLNVRVEDYELDNKQNIVFEYVNNIFYNWNKGYNIDTQEAYDSIVSINIDGYDFKKDMVFKIDRS